MNYLTKDTICAISTATGTGALSIIRLSGQDSFAICEKIFKPFHKTQNAKPAKINLNLCKTQSIHYGTIYEGEEIIDDVLVSVFKAPHSYTGEPSIEITCHGSLYIQQKIIELLINNGARLAKPGEYTLRAFLNHKFDLSQAEAVADLIASNSKLSHQLAINQMRGGFSDKIKQLRQQLMNFSSLIELELDFSEEDVQFADRNNLSRLLSEIKNEIALLIDSFRLGNVLKHGIPVAIIGKPNVGKSTLLNVLLNEEKAIVSEIPGTTRDAIEDTFTLEGITFRFIDTAGLREASDQIETFGIEKTWQKINQASVILFVFDINHTTARDIINDVNELKHTYELHTPDSAFHTPVILIANKIDLLSSAPKGFKEFVELETIFVSAKRKENISMIAEKLLKAVKAGIVSDDMSLVSNLRHYEALSKARNALISVEQGIKDKISNDLVAIDLNDALYHLGEITGEVVSEEILDNIFKNFCIGK